LTPVLVDSNVLIDVAQGDPRWAPWSSTALVAVGDEASLVINPVIYAEVSIRYATFEAAERALPSSLYRREEIPYPAAFLAGRAHARYPERGGRRRSTLSDFMIGAHAAIAGYRLLTRDPRRYRSYFPTVELISPS
jgi:predicted nucleic acid-binding protein